MGHCCNCNLPLLALPQNSSGLLECVVFKNGAKATLQGRYLKILDVLKIFYDFEGKKKGSEKDSSGFQFEDMIMCAKCIDNLLELYKLYNEYLSLSKLSNSTLSKYMSLRKIEFQMVGTSSENTRPSNSRTKTPIRKHNKTKTTRVRISSGDQVKGQSDAVVISVVGTDIVPKEDKICQGAHSPAAAPVPSSSSLSPKRIDCIKEEPVILRNGNDSELFSARNNDDSNSGEFKCTECTRSFNSQGALKVHYGSHFKEEKICKECGKDFKTEKARDLHIQVDHNGLKPHQCSHPGCGKQFRLRKKLLLHIKVMHEKKKPHPCPKCEKSFRTKYDLKVHDVGKHVQGDNSIGCSKCRRKFHSRDELEKHVLSHEEKKPFICIICEKGFQTASRLNLHSKSHQEIPSYICSVCGKAYKHKRDLLLHEVIHQDESTFRFGCGDCSRRFYRIDLLRNHQSNENHFSPETVGPSITKFHKNSIKLRKSPKKLKPEPEVEEVNLQQKGRKRKSKPKPKIASNTNITLKSEHPMILPLHPEPQDIPPTPGLDLSSSSGPLELQHFPLTSNSLFPESLLTSDHILISTIPVSVHPPKDQPSSLTDGALVGNESEPDSSSDADATSSLFPIPVFHQRNGSNTIFSNNKDPLLPDRILPLPTLPTFNFTAGAEQVGIDVINAFINNNYS